MARRVFFLSLLILVLAPVMAYGAGGDEVPPIRRPGLTPVPTKFQLREYVVSYLVPFDGRRCDTSHPRVNLADRITLWVESDDPLEDGRQVASGDGSAEAVVYGEFHIGYDVWARLPVRECPGMAYREREVGDYYSAYKQVELFRYEVGP